MASPTKDDLADSTNDVAANNEQENQSDVTSSSDDAVSQEKKDEPEAEEFDGDPDELCSQLENMELTEEETEELLKEALEINKKLKAELVRQDREKSAKSGKRQRQSRGTPNAGERPGSGRYGVLPPIKSKGNAHRHSDKDKIYGVKSSPTKTGQTSHNTTKSRDGASVSAGHGNKRQSSKNRRVTQSADSKQARGKAKPEWDDRFSFS